MQQRITHVCFLWLNAMHLSQLTREQSFGNIFTFMPININCVAMDNCINTKIIRNIPECKSVKNSFEPKPKQAHARSKWCRRNVNNSRSRFKPKGETPINFLLQWKFYLFFRNLSTKIWMEYFFCHSCGKFLEICLPCHIFMICAIRNLCAIFA